MVYLDNNATTPVAPEVREAMLPYLSGAFANPSSPYHLARSASGAVDQAREQVAALIGATPEEIVFTSGGTESNNTAVRGAARCVADRDHVITTRVEHSSVLNCCNQLSDNALRISLLPVDGNGELDLTALDRLLTRRTALVSVMLANNETGVLFPVREAAERAHAHGALFHTDAIQAAGKIPIDVNELGADLLSLSGHKFHGPKGIGALYIRKGCTIPALLQGGQQERGRRPGTENVPGIAGMGKAAELASEHIACMRTRVRALRDDFEHALRERCPGIQVAGAAASRLPNTSTVLFDGVEAEALLTMLDLRGICCSSGSACATGSPEPSHVLDAMGLTARTSRSAVRFSLSRYNTKEELARAVDDVVSVFDGWQVKA